MGTFKVGSGASVTPGWHKFEIDKAVGGTYNDTKYVQVYLKDYPEWLNFRVYEKKNEDGTEWSMHKFFYNCNAGVTEVLNNEERVVNIDINPELLTGCTFWGNVYKDLKGYNRVSINIVPAGDTILEKYTEEQIENMKIAATPKNGSAVYTDNGTDVDSDDDLPI